MITMTDQSGNVYGVYDERQTVVNLRRYVVTSASVNDLTLTAGARRAYVPLVNDIDESDINNIGALEEALKAIKYFDAVDYEHGDGAMRHAIWLLNGEYARYETETEIGSAQLDSLAGGGSICNIL